MSTPNITFDDLLDRLDKVKGPLETLTELFRTAKKRADAANRRADRAKKRADKPKKRADKDAGEESGASLADYLNWNAVHKAGQDLWKELMRAAIWSIDSGAKGHSELLNYLKAATEFEDLLYGLEPFYRDHTLHSLWVYLIGVKLMGERGQLGKIAKNLNWYVYNDVEKGDSPKALLGWAGLEKDYLNEVIQKKRDAIWCIIALCHDLGYSLAKLRKLNKKVQAVLKFYDVADFRHVGYTLDLEHQYLVKQFLELMAMDVRITPGNDYPEDDSNEKGLLACIAAAKKKSHEELRKDRDLDLRNLPDLRKLLMSAVDDREKEKKGKKDGADGKQLEKLAGKAYDNVLTKCFRDDSSYWRLCKALEKKEHGILSAYLLYKIMGIFADTSVRSPAEGWGLEDEEAVDNIIRGDILFAIAQHEFAYAHINQMSSLAEILILCDELEEFSRLGRQLQSRKYHDTTANTAVEIKLQRGKGKRDPLNTEVDIAMTYNSRHQRLPEFAMFCWRKARRLCRLFSLGSDSPKKMEEAYLINEIKMRFTYYDKRQYNEKRKQDYEIIFIMQKKDRAVTIQLKPSKSVKLECRDDDIYMAKRPDESLQKWLKKKMKIKEEDWPDTE